MSGAARSVAGLPRFTGLPAGPHRLGHIAAPASRARRLGRGFTGRAPLVASLWLVLGLTSRRPAAWLPRRRGLFHRLRLLPFGRAACLVNPVDRPDHFHRFLIYIKRKSSHEMWIKLKEMFGGSTSHLVGGDSEELSSPSHHEELQVASTSGRDEFSSSSTSPTCSKTREETEHSMDQDMFSNEDSRISSSSSSGMHMCLMANGSKVSPTLTPNTSSNDESDDDDNDEEYNILVHNMAMVYASLHEEIKELEAQVLSLKKDLEKCHEGKSALDKMLSVQQSPNDKSGLGFNSNNKNKSKSKNNKKKGQDKVKDPAKLVCFKCKVEGHHVRSCPLKKKKHLSEKQQGKRPQGQGQAHARPQVEDRPLPKKNQDVVPQEKKSIKKRKGNTCYLCRVKGHFASSCLSGTLSNPIIVDDDYSLGKDKDGNVFAKFVGTQSGLKKRTIWVAKPIVTNLLGPNLVGDQQAQT
ncbi:hypothetical protein QYE76_065057 [Lolium multiflorum]|uniref:CCHC-type domain-containing protein n=1 Tax=Lolium multiflorum TaxID=4521 RepID=A0AAD8WAU7_LOLMU|nr:hypothetical protein QYE76_065057 [Lolium multiflorum]